MIVKVFVEEGAKNAPDKVRVEIKGDLREALQSPGVYSKRVAEYAKRAGLGAMSGDVEGCERAALGMIRNALKYYATCLPFFNE